ncbi:bifunctional glutamate N-acetyltransferase/amino-acid acetyltransferase ArgJ [Exiguobacterium sp.]|uniref:bifunctional glutamate N-acetyltransferase/amino-acid acetyltransferase ArgJ n=2 Tax=Exiguobacterium sp. TaxID=44751 RepID=UPI00289AD42A|nr:bifunctional glutamate N-acetyltransferase/amino-acid acetyltransferase ArgJ [Exiguobacterium sp.]
MWQVQVETPLTITTPKGFQASGVHVGLKRKRKDLGLIWCEEGASAAAVYTTNQVQAAPITVTKQAIQASQGRIHAVLVNSGNANACTGELGLSHAYTSQQALATHFGIAPEQVVIASTGIIGQPLAIDTLLAGISQLAPGQDDTSADSFAHAILTTDTGTKSAGQQYMQGDVQISVCGVAKGSGMIHPNMATMLGFLTTDATIEPDVLQTLLRRTIHRTFNCITVDGDSSTNDMVMILASGAAGGAPIVEGTDEAFAFEQAIETVCQDLAKQIARDGEGATKLIEVTVKGTQTDEVARMVAKQVVGSSLVKTAIFGEDANWGRIIAAVGSIKEPLDVSNVDIKIGSQWVLQQSMPILFDETIASQDLAQQDVRIHINLNDGVGQGHAYGCDLTYDYVKINASYRT